jgi:hypothetical protein
MTPVRGRLAGRPALNGTSLTELLLEGRDPQEARNEFVGLATCLRDKDRARRSAWRAGRDL